MTLQLTELACNAARRGGEAIAAIQNSPREIVSKGFRDDVTDADYAAENAVVAAIREQYPDHPIVSEENDFGQDVAAWEPPDGYWWLIDPLDGTTNFSRGIPHYCVSVAVLQGVKVVGGAIYDPVRDHMFAATSGAGATLNGQPLAVTGRTDASQAVLEAGLARDPKKRRQGLAIFNKLATNCRTVRTSGSAALALAYVAAGYLDAYVHLTLRPWDSAAGSLMIEEAGGKVTLPDGRAWRARNAPILVSNGHLHEEVQRLVNEALAESE